MKYSKPLKLILIIILLSALISLIGQTFSIYQQINNKKKLLQKWGISYTKKINGKALIDKQKFLCSLQGRDIYVICNNNIDFKLKVITNYLFILDSKSSKNINLFLSVSNISLRNILKLINTISDDIKSKVNIIAFSECDTLSILLLRETSGKGMITANANLNYKRLTLKDVGNTKVGKERLLKFISVVDDVILHKTKIPENLARQEQFSLSALEAVKYKVIDAIYNQEQHKR